MLPRDAKERKEIPIYSGFVKYFPDAMAACAQLSFIGNKQHNPGEPMHWAKEKSSDEQDAQMRHIVDPVSVDGEDRDGEGVLHAVKNAWRGMAILQRLADAGENIFAAPKLTMEDAVRDLAQESAEAVTSQWVPPRIPGGGILPDCDTIYVVRFENSVKDNLGFPLRSVSYEGPFDSVKQADEHARENPNNIEGTKSIHAINKP